MSLKAAAPLAAPADGAASVVIELYVLHPQLSILACWAMPVDVKFGLAFTSLVLNKPAAHAA